MSPYQLDCLTNGAPVHIYRRADGTVYAALNDFARFGTPAIKTIRVRLTPTSTAASVLNDKAVLDYIEAIT